MKFSDKIQPIELVYDFLETISVSIKRGGDMLSIMVMSCVYTHSVCCQVYQCEQMREEWVKRDCQ